MIFYVYGSNLKKILILLLIFNALLLITRCYIRLDKNNTLNFLDLNISICVDKHTFFIYRKPSYSYNMIPVDSNHPILLIK